MDESARPELAMKSVVVITTGGTIASLVDETGAARPVLTGEQLVESIPLIKSLADVEIVEFSRVPSQYLDFKMMLRLARLIEETISNRRPDGIVVTMGTNSMEENAYFLDLVVETDVPVVVTGAMRNRSLISSDVDVNLYDAIVAASSTSLRGAGVVVVMGGELHGAKDVVKTHTTSVSTFKSPNAGPIGVIRGDRVILYSKMLSKQKIKVDDVGARVDLIKYAMGMDGSLLEAAVALGAKGIVVEAFGGGHLMPATVPAIQKAIGQGVPVVVSSRCFAGELLEGRYSFEGGDTHLKKLGVIQASGLSGVKARVKLTLALSAGMTPNEIRSLFGSA